MPRTVLRLEVVIEHREPMPSPLEFEDSAAYLLGSRPMPNSEPGGLLMYDGITAVEVRPIREQHDKCGRLAPEPGYAPCDRQFQHEGACAHKLR